MRLAMAERAEGVVDARVVQAQDGKIVEKHYHSLMKHVR